MRILRLAILGGVLVHFLGLANADAQTFNRRKLPGRIAPPQPQQVQTNTTAAPAPATQAPAPVIVVPPIPTNRVTYRVVQPAVDPAKAKAAHEEAVRRTVEFQKKRADEGSESAQYELGLRYLKGDGVEKDEQAGRKWLALSSKNGYNAATKKLEELDNPPKSKEEK